MVVGAAAGSLPPLLHPLLFHRLLSFSFQIWFPDAVQGIFTQLLLLYTTLADNSDNSARNVYCNL